MAKKQSKMSTSKKTAKRVSSVKRTAGKGSSAAAKALKTPAKKRVSSRASASGADLSTLAGISSDAVLKATGKGWADWVSEIDRHGGDTRSHAEIAEMLATELGVKPWWSQMVTVGYEQAKGRREKHQKPGGYEISASRTIGVDIKDAFDAWASDARRGKWLKERDFTPRSVTPTKYVRGAWVDGKTSLAVNFYAKGAGKCQVTAQHAKIASAEEAAEFKAMWADRLEALRGYLEGR
jgi:hypothetical protein